MLHIHTKACACSSHIYFTLGVDFQLCFKAWAVRLCLAILQKEKLRTISFREFAFLG